MPSKVLSLDSIISKFHKIGPRTVLLYLHTIIFLVAIWSVSVLVFIIMTTEIDFTKDKYFKQGFENKQFLLCTWVSVLHIIYFSMYSLIDIIAVLGKKSEQALKIRKTLYEVANYILFSLVFPLTVVTSFLFWTLYYYDPEHMYPKQLEMFPDYLNHMMHTLPLPAIIFYMFIHVRKEPAKYKTLPTLILLLIVYNQVFFSIRKNQGVWVYPVFEFLTLSQIQGLGAFTLVAAIVSHFFGYYLCHILKDLRSSIALKLDIKNTNAMQQKNR